MPPELADVTRSRKQELSRQKSPEVVNSVRSRRSCHSRRQGKSPKVTKSRQRPPEAAGRRSHISQTSPDVTKLAKSRVLKSSNQQKLPGMLREVAFSGQTSLGDLPGGDSRQTSRSPETCHVEGSRSLEIARNIVRKLPSVAKEVFVVSEISRNRIATSHKKLQIVAKSHQ